jgi:hypothetical protein
MKPCYWCGELFDQKFTAQCPKCKKMQLVGDHD